VAAASARHRDGNTAIASTRSQSTNAGTGTASKWLQWRRPGQRSGLVALLVPVDLPVRATGSGQPHAEAEPLQWQCSK
jgi:hypothetical protein